MKLFWVLLVCFLSLMMSQQLVEAQKRPCRPGCSFKTPTGCPRMPPCYYKQPSKFSRPCEVCSVKSVEAQKPFTPCNDGCYPTPTGCICYWCYCLSCIWDYCWLCCPGLKPSPLAHKLFFLKSYFIFSNVT